MEFKNDQNGIKLPAKDKAKTESKKIQDKLRILNIAMLALPFVAMVRCCFYKQIKRNGL